MEEKAARRAINQAYENYHHSNILSLEILILSAAMGMGFKSWWVFGGAFFGLYILLVIPYLGTAFLLTLSAIWGAIGWNIGASFESLGAQVVLGAIGFFMGVGVHFSGRQWFADRA